jgi:CSLREA domain-containing protein
MQTMRSTVRPTRTILFVFALALSLFGAVQPSVRAAPPPVIAADQLLGQVDFTFKAPNRGGPPTAGGLNLPLGVAIHASSGRLYVADALNYRVLSWPDVSALAIGQDADLVIGQPNFTSATSGLSASKLHQPSDVAVDKAGNLYVADTLNNRVLEFDNPATGDTVADWVFGPDNFASSPDSGSTRLKRPGGVEIDALGNLYVADTQHHRVLRYDNPLAPDENNVPNALFGQANLNDVTLQPVSAKSLSFPLDIALDRANILYVADSFSNRVVRFDNAASVVFTPHPSATRVYGQPNFTSSAAGASATQLRSPSGVAVDGAGTLYVAEGQNNRILRFDAPASDAVADAVIGQLSFTARLANRGAAFPDATTLAGPARLAISKTGGLLAADSNNHRVLGYDITVVGRPPLTLTVNSLDDARDLNPGNGTCDVGVNTQICTLRAAIQETNAVPTADTVIVPTGAYVLTRSGANENLGATGDLDIADPAGLTISGANAFVDGNRLDRVFHILPSANAQISGLTIQRAHTSDNQSGSAIRNQGRLTLNSVTVTDTSSSNDIPGEPAIFSSGVLELNSSTVRNNSISAVRSGELDTAALTINDSVITDNGNFVSTGVGVGKGTATINRTTIRNNGGGGLQVFGQVTLSNSLIQVNAGTGIVGGGGLVIINSTVSGNGAVDSNGVPTVNTGGLDAQGGEVVLRNVTITGNRGIFAGGLNVSNAGKVRFQNTLVAGNTATNANNGAVAHDCSAFENPNLNLVSRLKSEGFNLIGTTAGCPLSPDSVTTGNLTNQNAQLDTLKDNGGPTLTHALRRVQLAAEHPDQRRADRTGCHRHVCSQLQGGRRGQAVQYRRSCER